MLEEGLFETDYSYYLKLGIWLTCWFFGSIGLSLGYIGGGSTVMRMLGAGMMGIFWQQLAGLGHDLGHSGVSHNFHKDHLVGSILSSLMGLSVCWWPLCCLHKRSHLKGRKMFPVYKIKMPGYISNFLFDGHNKQDMGKDIKVQNKN